MRKGIKLVIAVAMAGAMMFTAVACGCSNSEGNSNGENGANSNASQAEKIHDPIEYATDPQGNSVVALYKSTMDANEKGEVVIENEFENKPVKGVTEGAFTGNSSVKKVAMPDTVEYIERMAFRGCRSLTQVNFPDTLKSVGEAAFMATSIKEVTLTNVESIGKMAFANNVKLEKVTINGSITRLENIVEGASKLKELHLPATITEVAEDFTVVNGATVYTPDNSVVIDYCIANGINYQVV
ncbi:MAG: leucine-rich repeat domain-containing protein [Acutalibacteraceae bacterium]|nr:leucine-rich repeat domain-containing protein [Acutalibacteraceae bacterium]